MHHTNDAHKVADQQLPHCSNSRIGCILKPRPPTRTSHCSDNAPAQRTLTTAFTGVGLSQLKSSQTLSKVKRKIQIPIALR